MWENSFYLILLKLFLKKKNIQVFILNNLLWRKVWLDNIFVFSHSLSGQTLLIKLKVRHVFVKHFINQWSFGAIYF